MNRNHQFPNLFHDSKLSQLYILPLPIQISLPLSYCFFFSFFSFLGKKESEMGKLTYPKANLPFCIGIDKDAPTKDAFT